jgi:hypothetical protein
MINTIMIMIIKEIMITKNITTKTRSQLTASRESRRDGTHCLKMRDRR